MKKLILKLFLICALVATIILLSILMLVPQMSVDNQNYIAATIDKHSLLQNTECPRIIFVGGSNLAFGLDSELIETATSKNVVNMGLEAGVGLRFCLAEVEPYIKKGDVIIVVPEYENFYGGCFDGSEILAYYFLSFPESWKYLKSSKQYLAIIKGIPKILRERLFSFLLGDKGKNIISGGAYSRKAFNKYGDAVGHLGKENMLLSQDKYSQIKGEIDKDVIPSLNSFKSFADGVGARVFFIHPCLAEKQYIRNETVLKALFDMLQKGLKVPILSSPLEYMFTERYFCDTVYHLNSRGRKIRTKRIINDLKKSHSKRLSSTRHCVLGAF